MQTEREKKKRIVVGEGVGFIYLDKGYFILPLLEVGYIEKPFKNPKS